MSTAEAPGEREPLAHKSQRTAALVGTSPWASSNMSVGRIWLYEFPLTLGLKLTTASDSGRSPGAQVQVRPVSAEQDGDGGWGLCHRSRGSEAAGARITAKWDDGVGLLVRHEQPGASRIEAEVPRGLPPRRFVPD